MTISQVLHVDDDKTIGRIVELILTRQAGWEVSFVTSGEAALSSLSAKIPDVILLDVMMPLMDGPTTLEEMRTRGLPDSVPVIFVTAKVLQHQIDEYRAMGVAGVIKKPFDPRTLIQDIEDIALNYLNRTDARAKVERV